MHIFESRRGATRHGSPVVRRAWWAALLFATAGLAVTPAGQQGAVEVPREPEAVFGAPVNIYAPGANPYDWQAGEPQPWHVRGQVWLMAGGASNITVQVGAQGAYVIDSGTEAMASTVLPFIQQLAAERATGLGQIRWVVNTNGLAHHIGGNRILREAGTQINAGEQSRQQNDFGTPGAYVFAHENVLSRLVSEGVDPELWPTDLEGFDRDSKRFNGEAVEIYHPRSANTDGQLVVLFRESDVLVVGDVVDMTGYPIIDVARGGTIDGLLVAVNTVIDMAVPDVQSDGGTLIVPGHGRLVTQTDVSLYRNMLTVIRNLVQYYKNEGMTLDEVLAQNVTEAYDERWGSTDGPWTTRDFVTAVYETLPANGPVYFSMENVSVGPGGREF